MKKNKDKKTYSHSFARRLTWRITLTLLIVMGITSVLIFQAAMVTIYTESDFYCYRIVKDKSKDTHHILSDIQVASANTLLLIEENLSKPDKLFDIMERIVRINPLIRSCGISFVENYYPAKGCLFCPFAIQQDSTTIQRYNLNDDAHNYLNEKWFTDGLKAKKAYWSDPYIDRFDKITPVVSYLAPIHDSNGRTVAIFGADLSLYDLENELTGFKNQAIAELKNLEQPREKRSKIKDNLAKNAIVHSTNDYEYDVYYFIIDSAGNYILHPEQERIVYENYFTYAKQSPDSLATTIGKDMIQGKKSGVSTMENERIPTLENTKIQAYFYPIQGTNWSICMVVPTRIIDIIGYILGGILLFLIAIGVFVVFFVGKYSIKRAVKPLKQLATSADEVAKGNFDTSLPYLKSRDEIHLLRDSFEQMQQSLTLYVEELKITTTEKVSIESELKIANHIQMAMLPKTFPPYPDRHDIDIYGLLKPAKAVGGDLFDFYIRDEKLFFCIGDVSGKGIPASLLMAVTSSLFRNISKHETNPHHIVAALNESMCDNNELEMFVTLFIGVLDLSTGLMHYCNAGHDAPLLIGERISILPCDSNLPIGVVPNWTFTQQQVTISPQTTLFLFTDGLNEAENAAHAQFGDERIQQIAKQQLVKKEHAPKTLIDSMTQSVNDFVGQAEQSDDLTMLAIQYTNPN